MRYLMEVAIRENVAPCFFEFIGIADERKTVGKIIYWYNLMDEKSERFGTTVAIAVKCN